MVSVSAQPTAAEPLFTDCFVSHCPGDTCGVECEKTRDVDVFKRDRRRNKEVGDIRLESNQHSAKFNVPFLSNVQLRVGSAAERILINNLFQGRNFISLWEGPSPLNVRLSPPYWSKPVTMARKGIRSEEKSDFIRSLMVT